MYSSSADAFKKLLGGEECIGGRCTITRSSPHMMLLTNGIRYFAVEVTTKEGVQYGISALDEEAVELERLASHLLR